MCKHTLTAIIYDKRGRVLSIGKNSYIKTHPRFALEASKLGLPEKQYIHAEADAIFKLKYTDKPYRIFVSRVTPGGNYANAKPCKVCQSLIHKAGIQIVEHT